METKNKEKGIGKWHVSIEHIEGTTAHRKPPAFVHRVEKIFNLKNIFWLKINRAEKTIHIKCAK